MTSFGRLPRPTPIPAPNVNMATYLAPTLSTIMRPDAERLASIAHSALIVHFATDESLETWPPCLENHIADFLHGAQLPQEYVATALALLAQLSFNNPHLYAANNDAECLFFGAMNTVALRYGDKNECPDQTRRYGRYHFQVQDRRWSPGTWAAILANVKDQLTRVWDKSPWIQLLDIDTFVSQSNPFERTPADYVKAGRPDWLRARFFKEVIRGVMDGDNLFDPDPRKNELVGPFGAKRAKIDCRLYCCFERGDKYPMPNNAPAGLPIHLAYRPWRSDDPYGSDFKHNTNGRLDIWTKGDKPETDPQVKIYHTIVEGPYQTFTVSSFRQNGAYWNLNAEEMEMWRGWETHLRRTGLLPASNEMERKLAQAIRKERALRRIHLAAKRLVNPSRSGSSSGSASGSGAEGEVDTKPLSTTGARPTRFAPPALNEAGAGPGAVPRPRRVPVRGRYNI